MELRVCSTARLRASRRVSTTCTAPRSLRSSRAARSRRFMGWCAGGLSISVTGSSRNSAWLSPSRRWAANCAPWVIASSRLVPAITPRPQARSRILKKLSRAPGSDRAREGRRAQRHRNLVRRRGARRPEEQDHPALGQARHASKRSQRSANRLGLYLRRHLSQGRQGRSPRYAQMRHRGDEPASGRNRHPDRAGGARRPSRRPGRLAFVGPAHRAAQHHANPVPRKVPRIEPAGKHLAVHARQLALKSDLQILRRYRRPLLRRMEQTHRSTLADHVDRDARLELRVLISESWYKATKPTIQEEILRAQRVAPTVAPFIRKRRLACFAQLL